MVPSYRLLFLCWLSVFASSFYNCNAQGKQTLSIHGLQAPVKVLRDQWGVNHIYAANQHDLFFAQGYCAAKDRLFQFEIWRRQATGTVAEIFGAGELKRDIGTRLFKFRGDLKKELQHYHQDGVAIITAYVKGVNAYIDEANKKPEQLPIEFQLLNIKPGYWSPEVVISRHQGLLGNIEEELNTGRAVVKVGEAKVKDIEWFHPKEPDLRLDPSITEAMLSKDILELYTAFRRGLSFHKEYLSTTSNWQNPALVEKTTDGSNNWIISGKRTASGFPILANDPHRSIALPSLRYMVHLIAPGWNVIGGGEPVIPGVSIGHNEQGAWGLTIFETDGEDLFVYDLNPRDLTQYKYKDQWVTMKEIRETIKVKDSASITASLRYTLHGPVTFIDTANRKAYAMRCAWMEPGGAPYLASLRMNQSKTWEEFRDASAYSHIPGENMIWADKNGNIGWQVVGITPLRKHFSGMVPVPGDGRFEWEGYQPIKERPHLFNPAKGFFATANQNVTPPDYTQWNRIGFSWADPFRGDRINEVLENDSMLTIEETIALQTDYTSLPARALVPMLQNITFTSELTNAAKAALLNWNFSLDTGSVAAGIYAMWERKLYAEATNQFVPKEIRGLVGLQLKKLITWLEAPDSRFGSHPVKGRDSFLVSSFEKAIADLVTKLGTDPDKWYYGQQMYKHAALNHPLDLLLTPELKAKLSLPPVARGGNSHTPNATGGADRQGHGASFRLITDLSDWDKALMINTPGQSADPRSPYYDNLYRLWANNQYFPAYFTKEKISGVTKMVTEMKPKR